MWYEAIGRRAAARRLVRPGAQGFRERIPEAALCARLFLPCYLLLPAGSGPRGPAELPLALAVRRIGDTRRGMKQLGGARYALAFECAGWQLRVASRVASPVWQAVVWDMVCVSGSSGGEGKGTPCSVGRRIATKLCGSGTVVLLGRLVVWARIKTCSWHDRCLSEAAVDPCAVL